MDGINKECTPTSVYPKLRRIARSRLRFGRDNLLDTTSLVHESYIRYAESRGNDPADFELLLRYAPRIMHNVVVDSIRRRSAQVHGGAAAFVELDTGIAGGSPAQTRDAAAVVHAIEQLERIDMRLAQIVEMRFFDGMTEPEIANTLGVAERTVRRDWEKAKLLLARAIRC